MTQQTRPIAEQVRNALESRPDHPHSYTDLYAALAAAGMDVAPVREPIQQALRYLASHGYVVKTGERATATFQVTGKVMERPRLAPEEAARRRKERDRLKKQRRSTRAVDVVAREVRVDRNTVVKRRRAKPAAVAPWIPGETVEQFEARGGQVERLTASWEQAA